MGRWFSWNGCAREQLPEFHIQKMLLEHHLDAGPCSSAGQDRDPDDCETAFDDLKAAARPQTHQAELAKMKAANGGFKLAYQLMSSDLYTYSKVLYIVLRPLWSWYADQVTRVRTSKHGLAELLALAEGRWMSDPQFGDLVTNSLHCSASLSYMEVQAANSKLSDRIVSLMRLLLGQRAWSMAARHHAPPQTYVGLLSRCPLRQRRAMDQMGREWATLLMLEQWRLVHAACLQHLRSFLV